MDIDILKLQQWTDKVETMEDRFTPTPLLALAALLDRDERAFRDGDRLPPCWHWLFFLPLHPQSQMDLDGHALRGGFLPPVPLPRRMWAGSQLEWYQPLRVGEYVSKVSRITRVAHKEGRSGPLVFVRVRHEIHSASKLALVEEQDIVYRVAPQSGEMAPQATVQPMTPEWSEEICPDPVLLFRYSAVTFNAHRIHYDRAYAMEVEGYPGLVVHGPLIATFLLESLHHQMPGVELKSFTFRALKPTFDTSSFWVCGARGDLPGTVRLWAEHADGALAMDATAECS